MTTTINHVANGRRPNLGEQINRLDKILDGLSEGLNDAIVDAVKTSVGAVVKEAVQAVLLEVFSNPAVLAKIQAARCETPKPAESVVAAPTAEPELPPRGRFQRVAGYLGEMQQGCGRHLRTAGSMATHLWQACLRPFQAALGWCNHIRKSHGRTVLVIAAGMALALTAWFAGPWIRSNAGVFVEHAVSVIANLGTDVHPIRRHRTC